MKPNFLSVFFWFLGFCLTVFVSSCSSEEPDYQQPTTPEINLTRSEQSVNNNLNDFGMRLFNAVSSDPKIIDKNPNFAVSPISMALALGMCANVYDDDFISGVLSALDCENIEELNSLCRKLMMYLPDPSNKCDLSLTNALWCDYDLSPTAPCRSAISDYFFGDISNLNFSNIDAAAKTINSWAARSTKNVIDYVVDPLELVGTRVLLANALYFKGEWETKFSKSNTVSGEFHGSGVDRNVDFMCDKRVMTYVACERFQAVTLSYKGNCSLIAVLPAEGLDIDDFSSTFDAADFARCIDERANYIVNLSLPKFESKIQAKCNDVLSSLGIDMHSGHLKGINGAGDNIYLDLGHTAKVSTDEDGTVAAAVTVGIFDIASFPNIVGEVTLNFDRPFIYFIRNATTGSIIMAGRFVN